MIVCIPLLLALVCVCYFYYVVALLCLSGPLWRATSFPCLRAGPFSGDYWPGSAFPCTPAAGIGGIPGGGCGWDSAAS